MLKLLQLSNCHEPLSQKWILRNTKPTGNTLHKIKHPSIPEIIIYKYIYQYIYEKKMIAHTNDVLCNEM